MLVYFSVQCEDVVLYKTVHHITFSRKECKIFKFCCLNCYELPLHLAGYNVYFYFLVCAKLQIQLSKACVSSPDWVSTFCLLKF